MVTILPSPEVQITSESMAADHGAAQPGPQSAKGRFKRIGFDHHVPITYGDDSQKMNVYADLLRRMIIDQRAWILDHSLERVTDEENAVESLRIAQGATTAANRF